MPFFSEAVRALGVFAFSIMMLTMLKRITVLCNGLLQGTTGAINMFCERFVPSPINVENGVGEAD